MQSRPKPGQVVIAGHQSAVLKAIEGAKAAGARRAIILPVSVPSHCALMYEAANKFAQRLDEITFSNASVPVVQNFDAIGRTSAPDIKQALVQQLYQPVRWLEIITKMKADGITRIIECGPGKVLTGLIKRIDRGLECMAIFDTKSLETALS